MHTFLSVNFSHKLHTLSKLFCLTALLSLSSNALAYHVKAASDQEHVLVGGFSKKADQGVHLLAVSKENQQVSDLGLVAKVDNASYLALSKNNQRLFSVAIDKAQNTGVQSFNWDNKKQVFTPQQFVELQGKGACHLSLDKTETELAIANYGTGELHVLSIDPSTGEFNNKRVFTNIGKSITKRQESAHLHYANWSPDNKHLYATDLGTDEILVFDTSKPKFVPQHRIKVTPGDGPRHLVFHQNQDIVYSVNELSNSVSVFKREPSTGNLTQVFNIGLLTADDSKKVKNNTASALRLSADGRFLYTAVRGVDALFVLAINGEQLTLLQRFPLEGKRPRDLNLSQSQTLILVANQDSNTVEVINRDPQTGLVSASSAQVSIDTPSYIGAISIN